MLLSSLKGYEMKKSKLLKILPLIMGLSISLSVQAKPQNQISFISDRTGETQIYLVNEDGSDLTNISTPNFDYTDISNKLIWSPNGEYLAFEKKEFGVYKLYIMDFKTKKTIEIPFSSEYSIDISWSADSSLLAFSLKKDENTDSKIYLVNSNGENLHLLYDDNTYQHDPKCSPEGQKILFISSLVDKKSKIENRLIKIVNKDGTNPIKISCGKEPSLNDKPQWSPDGKRIVFSSQCTDNFEIFISDVDGKNTKNLTKNKDYDGDPIWSPDGEKIAFKSNINNKKDSQGKKLTEPFILYLKTLKQKKISANLYGVTNLSWSYDSKKLSISYMPEFLKFNFNVFDINKNTLLKKLDIFDASWSPNENKLIFTESIGDEISIFLLDTNSQKIKKIIPNGKFYSWRVNK
jgi:Tol biopolymer transport system component